MHKETRRLFKDLAAIDPSAYRRPQWIFDTNKACVLQVGVKDATLQVRIHPDGSYQVSRLRSTSATVWDVAAETAPKGLAAAQFKKDQDLAIQLYKSAELHAELNYKKDVDLGLKNVY